MSRLALRRPGPMALSLPLLLPAAIYGLAILLYYRRLRTTLALPDYGDLWRMSVRYSADGRLQFTEPFAEAQPFAHIPVVHAVMNHLAITRADYSILWLVGALSAIGTGWLVGAGLVAVLPRADRGLVGVSAAALTGVLAFRFDVRNLMTNSLLLESQLLFLQGTLAMFVAGRYATVRHGRIRAGVFGADSDDEPPRSRLLLVSSEPGLLALLLALLVIGDAPTGVLSMVMIGLALTAGFVARRPLNGTFRVLGVLAIASLGIRWIGVRAFGSSGGKGIGADLDVLATVEDTLKLIGAGFVNLTGVFHGRQETYDLIHVVAAVVAVSVLAVAIVSLLCRDDAHPALAVCLALAVGFVVAGALAIAAIRGVGPNHQGSRAARGTALIAPATLVSLHHLLRSFPRTAAIASAITVTLAAGLLLLRAVAFTNSYENVNDVIQIGERTVTVVCERPVSVERWELLWPGFSPATIDRALNSEHLDIVRRARCDERAESKPGD